MNSKDRRDRIVDFYDRLNKVVAEVAQLNIEALEYKKDAFDLNEGQKGLARAAFDLEQALLCYRRYTDLEPRD